MGQNKLKKDKITKNVTVSKNGKITNDYDSIKSLLSVYFDLYNDEVLLMSKRSKCYMLKSFQFGFTRLSILVNAFNRSKYTFFISYDSVEHLYVAVIYKK